VAHTYAVIDRLELTAKHAIEVETSARTFAWTGQDESLTQYKTARGALVQDEDALRHLTADNLSQQRRLNMLEPQVRAALELTESIVDKRRQRRAFPDASEILPREANCRNRGQSPQQNEASHKPSMSILFCLSFFRSSVLPRHKCIR
jgi:CHASE3 domain sensor protein